MRPSSRRLHRVIAILLVIAAGLFVVGVSAERDEDTHHDEPGAEAVEHNEASEMAEGAGAEGSDEGASAAAEAERNEGGERVLGVDLESPVLVAGAVVVSLLLAGFVWRRPDRRLLIAIAAFTAGFAVFDIAEFTHQLDEDRTGLAVLAAILALLHAGIGALATQQACTQPSADREPDPT
jgi:hypothetical protein